jgi:low affinity Fe/Cu permease
MNASGDKTGLIIFGIIAVIVIIAAIAAYALTGNMGIEERFSQAVGLPSGETGAEGGSLFGFSIEGNQLSYLVVLSILVVVCYFLYRQYMVEKK